MSAGYFDKPIRFATGLIATGAAIAVRDTGGTLADIFSNEALSVSKSNPGVVDADGRFIFYADQGEYDITVGAGASAATYRVFLGANADLTFSSRSDLVTWWASNSGDAPSGAVVSDSKTQYVKDGGSDISDLSGLSPFGDVTPNHFAHNASPGTTNMTAAINAAIAYVDGLGGGSVHLLAETYGVDRQGTLRTNGDLNYGVKLITTNPVFLVGQGRGVSIIEPIPDSTNVFHVVKLGQRIAGTYDGIVEVATLSKGGLRSLTVKGNLDRAVPDASVSFVGGSCIDVSDGDGVALDDYEAHNAYGYCVGFQRGVFKNVRNTNGILYNSGADCIDAKMDDNAASNANNIHSDLVAWNCGRQRNTVSGTEVLADQAVFDLRVGHSGHNLTVASTASAEAGKWVVGIRTQHDADAGTDNDDMDNMSTLSDCKVQMSGANTRAYQFSTYNQQASNLTALDAVSNFYIRSYNGNYSNLVGRDGSTNLEIYESASEGIDGNKFSNCDMRGGTSYDVRIFGTDGVSYTSFSNLVANTVNVAAGTTSAQFIGGKITSLTDNGTNTVILMSGRPLKAANIEITPELFGAVGNGVADDTDALNNALALGQPVAMKSTYLFTSQLQLESGNVLYGGGTLTTTDPTGFLDTSGVSDNSIHRAAILGDDKSGILLDNITVNVAWNALPPTATTARAVRFWRGGDNCVRNCRFTVTTGAINATGSTNCRVIDNSVTVSQMGALSTIPADGVIDLWTAYDTDLVKTEISGNTVEGGGYARWGIMATADYVVPQDMSIESLIVTKNIVTDCFYDGIWVMGRDSELDCAIVSSNIVRRCREGVSVSDARNVIVGNNVIEDMTGRGIHLHSETAVGGTLGVVDAVVTGNVLIDVASGGDATNPAIWIKAGGNNLVTGNSIKGTTHGIGVVVGSSVPGVTVTGNDIEKGRGSKYLFSTDTKVDANSYSPTLTGVANVSTAWLLGTANYQIAGDICTVTLRMQITATAPATTTDVRVSLPYASNITSNSLFGIVAASAFAGQVSDDATNDAAIVRFTPPSTSATIMCATFSYKIV